MVFTPVSPAGDTGGNVKTEGETKDAALLLLLLQQDVTLLLFTKMLATVRRT